MGPLGITHGVVKLGVGVLDCAEQVDELDGVNRDDVARLCIYIRAHDRSRRLPCRCRYQT